MTIPVPQKFDWLKEITPPLERREEGKDYHEWHYYGKISDFDVDIAKTKGGIYLVVSHFHFKHLDWNKYMTVKVPFHEHKTLLSAEEELASFLEAYEESRTKHCPNFLQEAVEELKDG